MSDRGSIEVAIALGSNLGDRQEHFRATIAGLLPYLTSDSLIERSPIFETEPVDCPPGSPRYYNAVAIIQCERTVGELLAITQQIEQRAGRASVEFRAVNTPRPIDIDLLYAGDERMATAQLVLPHPRLHLRRFVLEPLAGLRPDLVLPGYSQPLNVMLDTLQSEEPPLEWVTDDW